MNKTPGRPKGDSDARKRLIDAALELFFEDGYEATTVRRIAARAGVDHALVNYYFGSKEGLFTVVVELPLSPGRVIAEALSQGPAVAAPRLLAGALTAWDQPEVRARVRRLLADMHLDEAAGSAFRNYLQTQVADQIAEALGGPDASKRADAAAAVIAGLFITRYVVRLEPLASMPRAEVIRYVAPALQACLLPVQPVRRTAR